MNIVEFWRNSTFESDRANFLAKDNIAENYRGNFIQTFDDYVGLVQSKHNSLRKYQPYLFPKPYSGDVLNAEVLVLLRNPSFNHIDVKYELDLPQYRELLRGNLEQQIGYNFALNPEFCWTPDFAWWEPRLRKLAEHIQSHSKRSYGESLMLLATKVAFVELEAYRSISGINLSTATASIDAVREWVQNEIRSGRRTFLLRAQSRWDLDLSNSNSATKKNQNARSAYITPKSDCGVFILKNLQWC